MILGRKIALFALSEAIRQPTEDAERAAAMRVEAEQLLFDEESFNDSCRIEFAELARAVSLVAPDLLGRLPELFGDGPRIACGSGSPVTTTLKVLSRSEWPSTKRGGCIAGSPPSVPMRCQIS